MDTTPIVARLSVIANSVSVLRELKQLTAEEFSQDHLLRAAAEREFQVAIQAALDIGSMLLADVSVKVPENYKIGARKPTPFRGGMKRVAGV